MKMTYKSNERHKYFIWCNLDKLIKSLCIHTPYRKEKFEKDKRQRKSSSLSEAEGLFNSQALEHDNISSSKEILNTFLNTNNESRNNNNNIVRKKYNVLQENDVMRKDFTDDMKYIQCIHNLNEIVRQLNDTIMLEDGESNAGEDFTPFKVDKQTSNQNNTSKSGVLFKKFDTTQMIIYEIVYATNLLAKTLMRIKTELNLNTQDIHQADLKSLEFEDSPRSCGINITQEHPSILINHEPPLWKAEQNVLITIEDINPIETTEHTSRMKDQLTNSSSSNYLNLPPESYQLKQQRQQKKSRSSYGDTDIYSESTNISIFIPYDDTTLQKYQLKTTQNSTTLYTFEEMISDNDNCQELNSVGFYSEKVESNNDLNESKGITTNETKTQNDSGAIIKKYSTFLSQKKRLPETVVKTRTQCQSNAKILSRPSGNLPSAPQNKKQRTSTQRSVQLNRKESFKKSINSKEKLNSIGSHSNRGLNIDNNREKSLSRNPQKVNLCKRHKSDVIMKVKNVNINKAPFK